MTKLLIGSKNPNKIAEISAILSDFELEIRSLADFPDIPDVKETASTFEGNATLKATAWAKYTGLLTIADDSGLCVDALDGAPGVYSARFAGAEKNYAANNAKLLEELKNIPFEKRAATFCTVIALADAEKGLLFTAKGSVKGFILEAPRGTNGFGYDPLFFYPPLQATFAELAPEVKNKVSHRFHALKNFKEKFARFMRNKP